MNNPKDIQKTGLSSYGQSSFAGVSALLNKPVYEFANKKTEKLVTALYMVTDCMETDDALKGKLRLLGVQLLSNIYELNLFKPGFTENHIRASLNNINEIFSFIDISNTMGYISEMNTSILRKEFNILVEELNSYLPKDKSFPFTLDEKMFEVKRDVSKAESLSFNKNPIKRTNNMSFINNKTESNVLYKPLSFIDHKKVKSDRVDKILNIIKDLPLRQAGKTEATIKDIALAFPECSEKTIQRELNDLIEKGQLKKSGDKRWSRYGLITKTE